MNLEEDRKISRIAQHLPLPSFLRNGLKRVTSRSEGQAKLRSIYLGLVEEYSGVGNVEKAQRIVRSMDATDPFEVIYVLANVDAGSKYPFEFIDATIGPLGFEHASSETFVGTDVRGDLYRRSKAGPESGTD
jgi:hypothetical protein